ncbi:hypothetical protein L2E82_16702 [Cichorium intybus]|uniref:Uncharacterized protein n=1 Tax=Cichorium intybus TaxID=13427 RepID=A0ACB9F5W1_CICIN|nr:hypothetical protein L2E82_16702 [Cichorium intybus]
MTASQNGLWIQNDLEFAQFFIKPLMSSDATTREIKAVDSENQKNLLYDAWRIDQPKKDLSAEGHPYRMFSTGNRDTLEVKPKARGVDTRYELLKFYKENCSANPIEVGSNANINLPVMGLFFHRYVLISTCATVQATSEVSQVMFESAVEILLLLTYMINMSPDDVSRLQHELFPLIQEIITEWHIIHLFTTTPSESPAMEDFSSQLSLLQTDNNIDRRSWNEKLGKSDFTLAFIMLLDHQSSFKDQNRVDSKHLPNPTSFIAPSETNHERIDALRTVQMRQKRSDSKPLTENELRGPNEGRKKKNGRFEAKLQVFGLIRNMQLEGY